MPTEIIINIQTPITYYLFILLSVFHSVVSKIVMLFSSKFRKVNDVFTSHNKII